MELSRKTLILDGGMGTMLQRLGLQGGDNEELNVTRPDAILSIHQAYIDAGADIIETNSFGANRLVQSDYGKAEHAAEFAFESARIARKAADAAGRKVLVAGSMGPTGKSLTLSTDAANPAFRAVEFDEMAEAYREQADALAKGGADVFLIETAFDALNVKAAIYALEQLGSTLPVIISATVSDRSGRTLTGQTLEAFYHSVRHCPQLVAFGLNCALGAEAMAPLAEKVASFSDLPLIFYPNAGIPDELGRYSDSPETFAATIKTLSENVPLGIAGGCCGTTPDHIRMLREKLRASLAVPPFTMATGGHGSSTKTSAASPLRVSGLESYAIGTGADAGFTNIGERTNISGSKKFARLIEAGDYRAALDIAAAQIEGGASVIDINLDDAMLDSKAQMRTFLRHISAEPDIAKAAIMIDSSDWETITEGLENVQGKSIVNSISLKDGETEFLRKARHIRDMGAAMVVMAFDEKGQATSYERKVEICRRAYNLLTSAGILPQDIIFDCNILSIGTGTGSDARYAIDFIEAVRWIKANLPGAKTSGGLSNLSFAFRGNNTVREAMHSVFLYHAIRAGLDMAIVNPGMLQIYDDIAPDLRKCVEDVIMDTDPGAANRLLEKANEIAEAGKDSNTKTDAANAPEQRSLSPEDAVSEAVIKGRDAFLEDNVMQCYKNAGSAVQVIEGPLMKGM